MFDDKKKRRRDIFDEMFEEMRRWIEDIEKSFFEDFEEFERIAPKIRTPFGNEVRGPIVWGWSMTIGPDGKPVIREFGNIPKKERGLIKEVEEEEPVIRKEREPLIDVIEGRDQISVVAEVPGVEKDEIDIECDGKELVIKGGDTYYKKLTLPAEVDPKDAKASYKNGILEVIFPKKSSGRSKIKIKPE